MNYYKPEYLTIEKFLSTVKDNEKRTNLEKLLNAMNQMFIYITENDDVSIDWVPEIRIRDSDEVGAEGNIYSISVDRGLIEYCYNLSHNILICIDELSEIEGIEKLAGIIPITAFCWVMAHEFYHAARGHNERIKSEDKRGVHETSAIQAGAEYDADSYAVYHVYRSLKLNFIKLFPIGPIDMLSRKIVFSALFLLMRGLPNIHKSKSHPSRVQRLMSFIGKLSMLRASPEEPFDEKLSFPDARNRVDILFRFMIDCEQHFIEEFGTGQGDLIKEIANELGENFDTSHIAAWDDMKMKPFKNKE